MAQRLQQDRPRLLNERWRGLKEELSRKLGNVERWEVSSRYWGIQRLREVAKFFDIATWCSIGFLEC